MRTFTVLAAAISACMAGAPVQAASVILPAGVPAPMDFRLLADYGSYRLFDGDASALPDKAWVLADAHLLKFDRLRIDTRVPAIPLPAGFSQQPVTAPALHIVQFTGPLQDAWLEQLRATGAVPIQYIDRLPALP